MEYAHVELSLRECMLLRQLRRKGPAGSGTIVIRDVVWHGMRCKVAHTNLSYHSTQSADEHFLPATNAEPANTKRGRRQSRTRIEFPAAEKETNSNGDGRRRLKEILNGACQHPATGPRQVSSASQCIQQIIGLLSSLLPTWRCYPLAF